MTALVRLLLVCCVLAVGGCKEEPVKFNGVDITGANYAKDFALTDHNGQTRTLADFRGKVVVMFFGFTQCPDVCPTTLADMAKVKQKLGAQGEQLQVLLVTLDPQRDTPAVLSQYVPGFDPSFLGLTGTPEAIAQTAKDFKVFYQLVSGKTATSYTLDHTAASYVFDSQGRVRLFLRYGLGVDESAADIKRLM